MLSRTVYIGIICPRDFYGALFSCGDLSRQGKRASYNLSDDEHWHTVSCSPNAALVCLISHVRCWQTHVWHKY